MEKQKQLFFKTKEIIYKASLVIMLGMFLYVFKHAFLDYRSMPFLDERTSFWQKGGLMCVGVILLIQFVVLFSKWIEKFSEHMCKVFIGVLFALLVVCQFVFLYTMKIQLRYDALKVLDEAVSLCKTGMVSPAHLDGYFARYTNNYPILFLTGLFLKVGSVIGIVDTDYHGAVFLLGSVNILAIDAAIYFSLKLVRKLKGIRGACVFALCVCLNPLFVIWVPFYYTNTLAMPFIALILYFFYLLFVENKCSQNVYMWAMAFGLGVCIVAGVKIRATTLLTIVACIMYVIFLSQDKIGKEDGKKLLKENFLKVCFLLIGMLATLSVYKVVETKLVSFDYTDSAFPAIHWINMGAGGTGEYNIWDEQKTMSFLTAEEKRAVNWESYLERLNELGVKGYANLLLQKLKLTFGDAGAGYRGELGVSDAYNDANLFLVGGKADFVGFSIQLQYVFSLICIICTLTKLLFCQKKGSNYGVVIFWNIAGAFVFHMLWEAGNIYSLSFAMLFPIGIILAKDLFLVMDSKVKVKKASTVYGMMAGTVWGVTLFLLVSLYTTFVEQSYETNDGVVNQYIYHWGDVDELQTGEELLQSFYGNREFNRIAFQVRNLVGPENDGVYQVQVLNEKKECLEVFEVYAKNYGDYDFVRLEMDAIKGNGQRYFLKVSKTKGSEMGNLVFLSYHTSNYDAYSYGELLENERLRDLCFSVYMTKLEPYCRKGVFVFCLGLILLVESVIFILYYAWIVKGILPDRRKS